MNSTWKSRQKHELFLRKIQRFFRQINTFTKEITTAELISRNFLSVVAFYSIFPH